MSLSSLSPRWRKILVAAVMIVVVYTLFGFFGLPPIAKSLALANLKKELNRDCSIEQIRINPFTLSATVGGLLVPDPDRQPLLRWDELHVNFQLSSFLGSSWNFRELKLQKPHVRAERRVDGTWNFSDLLNRTNAPATTPDAGKPFAIRIGTLQVDGGTLQFADRTRDQPFETTVGPFTLALKDLNTAAGNTNGYSFTGTTSATESFGWKGGIGFEPFTSLGTLSLSGIELNRYAPYYSDQIQCDIHGTAGLELAYHAAFDGSNTILRVSNGEVTLQSLRIAGRGQNPGADALAIPELTVGGAAVDLLERTIDLETLHTTNGTLNLLRSPEGVIQLATLLSPPTGNPAATAPLSTAGAGTEPGPPWSVRLGSFDLGNYSARFLDQSTPRPVEVNLAGVSLQLKEVTTRPGTRSGISLSLNLNTNGSLTTSGSLALFPPEADVRLDLKGIELKDFDPYLEPMLDLLITRGILELGGQLRMAVPTNGPIAASFEGDLAVGNFGTTTASDAAQLVDWGRLSLSGAGFQLNPAVISVERVGLDDFVLAFVMTTNGNNFARLIKPPAEGAPATPPPPATNAPQPRITITEVNLSNATLNLTDLSMEPDVHLSLNELSGKVSGISSEKAGSGVVALNGKVGQGAPFDISGRVDLLTTNKDSDVTIQFKEVEMLPFGPYVGRYLGHELDQGRLHINIHTVINGRDLASENVVTLDQFTLGNPVDSPDAVKAPVKLGVALLKDAQGRIELDVPVEGNLDDPQFRYGRVVWRAVLNLLLKAATSPFALLGKIAGGGENTDLSFLEFEPGSAESTELSKLDSLARALQSRPGLHLGITGGIAEAEDTLMLRRHKLLTRLRQEEAAGAGDTNRPAPGKFRMQEYTNAVQTAFARLHTTPHAEVAPAPAPATRPEVTTVSAPPARPSSEGLKGAEVQVLRGRRNPKPAGTTPERLIPAPELKETAPAERPAVPKPATPAGATVATPGGAETPGADVPPPPTFEEMEKKLLEGIVVEPGELAALAQARSQSVREHLMTAGMIAGERLSVKERNPDDKERSRSRVYFDLR